MTRLRILILAAAVAVALAAAAVAGAFQGGDRVSTPDGPGSVVSDQATVALDNGTTAVYDAAQVSPLAPTPTPTPSPTPTATPTPSPTPTPTPDPAAGCDLFASPTGSDTAAGTAAAPVRSAYQLSRVLKPGQTGCLRGGKYPPPSGATAAWFTTAGTSTAPIRLTSYPGERATIAGIVKLYAPFVVVDHVNIDGTGIHDGTVWVQAFDDTVSDSDVTNGSTGASCFNVGANSSWGAPAGRDLIARNRVHDCGTPADGNQDHAIYFENSNGSHVIDNVFWGSSAYVMHLYPNAQRNLIEHNVIADNARAVILAGSSSYTSSNNEVRFNLITDTSSQDNAVRSCWSSCGGKVGTGNTVHDNCLYRNAAGDFDAKQGYTATANLHADPLYADRASHDYRMQPGSPCLSVVGYDTAAKLAGG